MKAVILKEAGSTDNFSIEDIATPVPQPQEVLVKVHAAAVNPVDMKTRKGGAFLAKLQESGSVILGWDISGVVESVGAQVSLFKPGDEVFGMVNFPGIGKAYAAYVTAPEGHLARKPSNINHEDAAAATLAALTAWQALVHEAKVTAGQKVLIHAAAGGVGHFAIQIAKHLGAKVVGTASSSNIEFLKALGVDFPIDYTAAPFETQMDQVDVVLDPLGDEVTERSLQLLRPGGVLISIVGGVKEHLNALIAEKNIQAKNYLVHSSGTDMQELAALLERGIIKPHISHRYTLEEVAEAHRQIESGRTKGKIVLTLV
ncbi:MAG TPA: NADP-dependent oxidoreductase [Cyclobacteriaceae bacterium]|nr:NADP-dependent oxidoreductase [Cyclobacteriaceae bacterium]